MTPTQGESPEYGSTRNPNATDEAASLPPNRARQAVKVGPMRYVLALSTLGAIVVLVIAYFVIAK